MALIFLEKMQFNKRSLDGHTLLVLSSYPKLERMSTTFELVLWTCCLSPMLECSRLLSLMMDEI